MSERWTDDEVDVRKRKSRGIIENEVLQSGLEIELGSIWTGLRV